VAIALGNWNTIIDKLAKDLHSGKLDPRQVNRDVLLKNYEQMNKGVTETFDVIKNPETRTSAQHLSKNLYIFSGAKSYQELQVMNSHLLDNDGKIRSFSAFKKEVLQEHEKYNVNYLQAEYQTAKASSQTARDWQRFQDNKERYPHLKYNTQRDDAVSDEHAPLDGTVMHIDDDRWDALTPPLRFRCRCYLTQTTAALTSGTIPDVPVDPRFKHNPGKTGEVFNAEHPYFQIPSKVKSEIRSSYEMYKWAYPKYAKRTDNANVLESFYARQSELPENVRGAKLVADLLKVNVKIRPHVENGFRNPEYLIGKKIGDLKNVSSPSSLENQLRRARRQGCKFVVINLTQKFDLQKELASKVRVDKNSQFDYMIFIKGEKAVKLTREQLQKNNYGKLDNL
jgi:SPP1 gp7 family putative phage head morphogenesis protein